jgi:hypothetical protein
MQYNNLTELLLKFVRARPGMYLGKNKISMLTNFIYGYDFRDAISSTERDFFFGENGFLEWYRNKYAPPEMI